MSQWAEGPADYATWSRMRLRDEMSLLIAAAMVDVAFSGTRREMLAALEEIRQVWEALQAGGDQLDLQT